MTCLCNSIAIFSKELLASESHQVSSSHNLVVGADDPFSDEVETKHLRSQEVAAEDVVL